MSKISCNVIRDLMVLYEDHVCSEESRQMVEEHIAECEECYKLYQMTEEKLPDISLKKNGRENDVKRSINELQEVARRACKKLERRITYRHILAVSILLVVMVIVSCVWTEWLRYQVNVVPAEDVQVTELYELKSGDIYCTFACKNAFSYVNTGGIKVPEGKRYEACGDGWQEIYFQYDRLFDGSAHEQFSGNEVSVIFPKNKMLENAGEQNCAAIYYGRKDKEDKFLVWKEGQEIKPAPEKVEYYVQKNIFMPEEDNWYRYGEAIVVQWGLH